jgi:hypothetical protein
MQKKTYYVYQVGKSAGRQNAQEVRTGCSLKEEPTVSRSKRNDRFQRNRMSEANRKAHGLQPKRFDHGFQGKTETTRRYP